MCKAKAMCAASDCSDAGFALKTGEKYCSNPPWRCPQNSNFCCDKLTKCKANNCKDVWILKENAYCGKEKKCPKNTEVCCKLRVCTDLTDSEADIKLCKKLRKIGHCKYTKKKGCQAAPTAS